MFRHLLLPLLLTGATFATRAQQPTIDPAFVPTRCYAPAAARQAVQQPDGKIVVVGDWLRAEGAAAGPVVRYLAGGTQLDAAFVANTRALNGLVQQALPLANGKLLLVNLYGGTFSLGGVARLQLLRLNADGTPDAGFDAGAAMPVGEYIHTLLEQPDGKLVLGGTFRSFNGQAAGGIARLNPDGSLDTAFLTAARPIRFNGYGGVYGVVRQPDGKLLVSGAQSSLAGQRNHTIYRLLPSGAPDPTFDDRAGATTLVTDIALQPDGKLLAVVELSGATDSIGGAPASRLVRLEADGRRDAGFQLPASAVVPGVATPRFIASMPVVRVQPDGRILVASLRAAGPKRLLPNGSPDNSFAPDSTVFPRFGGIPHMQLLADGRVLLAGDLRHYGGPGSQPAGVALLTATGARDNSFAPSLQATGRINAVARQPDGKLLVGGFFSELNGQVRAHVARLNADGSLDAAFVPAAVDDEVAALAWQADGGLVLGGSFLQVGNSARTGLARLLPTGSLDAAFAPALTIGPSAQQGAWYPNTTQPIVRRLIAAPGGQVLALGRLSTTAGHYLARFNSASGQLDAGFQPSAIINAAATNAWDFDIAQLPSGKLMVLNGALQRLLPSGALDPTFSFRPFTAGGRLDILQLNTIAADAAERVYVAGNIRSYEWGNGLFAQRLLADGSHDAAFVSPYIGWGGPGSWTTTNIRKLLLQPNGRLLLGGATILPLAPTVGQMPADPAGVMRVMPSGAIDTAFDPARGPGTTVTDMLLEPDGAIVVAGTFAESYGGQPYHGLMRLRDANVLGVAPARAEPATVAWPVPARGQLRLALAAEARPLRVQLLDALGRVVRTQAADRADLTLDVAGLSAGAYILRVDYASGPVARRVVLE